MEYHKQIFTNITVFTKKSQNDFITNGIPTKIFPIPPRQRRLPGEELVRGAERQEVADREHDPLDLPVVPDAEHGEEIKTEG